MFNYYRKYGRYHTNRTVRRAYKDPVMSPAIYPQRRKTFGARVKQIINRGKELKFANTAFGTSAPVSGTGLVTFLTGIAEGDDELTRDGQLCQVVSIKIQLQIQGDTDAVAGTLTRLILFRAQKNVEGVIPTIGELLTADSVLAHANVNNRQDFRIYWDKMVTFQGPKLAGNLPLVHLSYYKKFKTPLKLSYDGGTTGIGDAERGHWFLAILTNRAAAQQPTTTAEIRIRFSDK